MGRNGFDLHLRQVPFDLLSLHQLCIAHFHCCIILMADHPVFYTQVPGRYLQLLCGQLHQDGPGFRTGIPERGAVEFCASRSCCAPVPRAELGISHHHIYGIDGHIKFLGQHLGHGSNDPLSHFNLAAIQGYTSIVANFQVGIEVRGIGSAALWQGHCTKSSGNKKYEHAAS